jgi:hypothetical protein
VVATVDKALQKNGGMTTRAVERWKDEMPIEQTMVPKDKYTIFDRKEKNYRKSIRSEYSLFFESCGAMPGIRLEGTEDSGFWRWWLT